MRFARRHTSAVLAGILLGLAAPGLICAQSAILGGPLAASPIYADSVGLDQHLGETLPLDLTFVDEAGMPVRLGDYFGEKPVLLALVYYECPMLCTQILNGLLRGLRVVSFDAGRDFEVVAVSIDPGETPALAAAKKEEYLKTYARPGAERGWHFLTGGQEQIQTLASAVGYRYLYDEKTDQYVHPSGIALATADGRLSRYFYGIDFAPKELRLGLVEASEGRIGNPVDQFLLLCYSYDPTTGKYTLAVLKTLRLAGLATVAALGGFVVVMLRRERSGPSLRRDQNARSKDSTHV